MNTTPFDDLADRAHAAESGADQPAAFETAEHDEPIGIIQDPTTKAQRYRSFTDVHALRNAIFDATKHAYANRTMQYKNYMLKFVDVDYKNPKTFSLQDEAHAVRRRGTLVWPLYGRLQLIDTTTNQVISEDAKPRKLTEVPYLTRRGTFINNGSEYIIFHQQRLKPGAYTRIQTNGDLETHFNVLKGAGFRVQMNPQTGVFKLYAAQSETPLYPILQALGVSDQELRRVWGDDLLNANKRAVTKNMHYHVQKVVHKLGNMSEREAPPDQLIPTLKNIFQRMEVDPDVMRRTLGKEFRFITPEALVLATQEILKLNRGERDEDVRDNLVFQSFHGPESFFAEHVEKDAGQYLRKAMYKAALKKSVEAIPDNFFSKQIRSVLLGSGLAAILTEINPLEIYDLRYKVTRTGEGGISSEMVPRSSRGVQPTHFGYIDPIRAPESQNIALDLRVAMGTKVGDDGRLYQFMRNVRTGQIEPVATTDIADKVVAFPGEIARALKQAVSVNGVPKFDRVAAMVNGKMKYVRLDEVDYELDHPAKMWSPVTYMVPFMSAVKGQRVSMGARMLTQALALKEPEAPLVRSKHIDPRYASLVEELGREAGAVFADRGGVVTKVTSDAIEVKHDDGTTATYELYNNFPFNQKGFLHNTPVVKPGTRIAAGQLLAKSNYTDHHGNLALGRNVLAALHAYDGLTHEDAIVISESAAKKFASEQMYEVKKDFGDTTFAIKKSAFVAKYPSKFTKDQLAKLNDDGVVNVGAVVQKGDPLVLSLGRRSIPIKGSLVKGSKSHVYDDCEIWDHDEPGEVVAVEKTRHGWNVFIKSYTPVKEGDKLSGLYGNKGIVSKIVPDSEMLRTADGSVIDIVFNPAGVISRVNPAYLAEAALGKVAMKTGRVYHVDGFSDESIAEFALKELEKHGMSDTEDIIDPRTGRTIKNVFVGVPFVMKLHHMAEGKMAARDVDAYTMDEQPAKGGPTGSKRIGLMEITSLLSHGATNFLEDMKLIRGQRNDDYWRLYRMGLNPPPPNVSKMYEKFEATLRGAGVHLKKEGIKTYVMPMTQQHIDELVGQREIKTADTIDFDTGEPIPGGLFDLGITGGKGGQHWSYIALPEALPNPLAEPMICSLLGITKQKFRDILAGKDRLHDLTGPRALHKAFEMFDVKREIEHTKEQLRLNKKSDRDELVKRLGYLTTLERHHLHPRDFFVTKVPVLPPRFRPVVQMDDKTLSADVNYLYKDLFEAVQNMKMYQDLFGDASEPRLSVYDAFKAIAGLGHPITKESQERHVRGLLKQVFGKSPKLGMYQRKVIGNPTDLVGRAVLAPGFDLDIDEVGLPVDMMWTLFRPFIMRRLVRSGVPLQQAMKEIEHRTPRAQRMLEEEARYRPVVINRAPSLHKFNLTAHFAKPIAGHTLKVNNLVIAGHAGDYDGDTLNIHVPVSEQAVEEAKERMLPSKSLISPRSFDVHLLPPHMYLVGLHVGSKPAEHKPPRVFATKADAIRAYRSGEIDADDPIVIGKA